MRLPLILLLFLTASSIAQPGPAQGLGASLRLGGLTSSDSDLDKGGSVAVSRLDVEAGYRIVAGDSQTARVSLGMESRDYDFSASSGLFAALPEDARQYRAGLNLTGPINDDWTWMLGPGLSWSSLGDADEADGLIFRGMALAIRRINERLSISFGALARTRLEDPDHYLPIIGIDWKITDRLSLRTSDEFTLGYFVDKDKKWSIDLAFVPREWEYRIEESDETFSHGIFTDDRLMTWLILKYQPNPAITTRAILGTSLKEEFTISNRNGHEIEQDEGDPPLHVGFDIALRL